MNYQFKDSEQIPTATSKSNIPFRNGQATFPENWSTLPSLGLIRIGDNKVLVPQPDRTWLMKDFSELRFTKSK